MEEYIEVKSYWGTTAKNEYISQGGERLAVLLPGQNYTNMAPLLYYSQNIAIESGYDTLAIEYGYQRTDRGFELSEESLTRLFDESKEAIEKCLKKKAYKELLFIGKSLGTLIQIRLKNEFSVYRQRHVFLTPIPDCIETIKTTDCIAVVGTLDRHFKHEHIKEITGFKNVKLHIIEGANHRIEKGNFAEDLKVLNEVCGYIDGFING